MSIRFMVIERDQTALQYLDDVVALLAKATQSNATPYLSPCDREFFIITLGLNHTKVLAIDDDSDGAIIGFSVLEFLVCCPDYLDRLDYSFERSAMVLFSLVDFDYRGQGINKRMAELRVEQAQQANIEYLFATVHPDNTASMKTLQGIGMEVIDQRHVFTEHLLRNILCRAL